MTIDPIAQFLANLGGLTATYAVAQPPAGPLNTLPPPPPSDRYFGRSTSSIPPSPSHPRLLETNFMDHGDLLDMLRGIFTAAHERQPANRGLSLEHALWRFAEAKRKQERLLQDPNAMGNLSGSALFELFGSIVEIGGLALTAGSVFRDGALLDPRTRLFNARAWEDLFIGIFNDRLKKTDEKMQRRDGIMIIDLDYFKQLNTDRGHENANIVLKAVCDFLARMVLERSHLGEKDVVVRYGGEEFVWVVTDTNFPELSQLAVNLRRAIKITQVEANADYEVNADFKGRPMKVTASIGCTLITESVESAVVVADRALFEAKGDGGRDVVFFDGKRIL